MPLLQRLEVEHAEQRIAAADVGVEEAERLAGLDRLDPQRHLGELDRHRVAVDAVDAGARHVAQRVAIVGRRGDAAGAGAREPRGDPPRRREQEMAGAAGRIEHRDREQRRGRIVGLGLDAVEHRVERAVEQRLHQAVGRVVAAAGLAGVALGLAAFGEGEAAAVVGEARRELQQALVDRAQLLGLHVAPVHRHEARILLAARRDGRSPP